MPPNPRAPAVKTLGPDLWSQVRLAILRTLEFVIQGKFGEATQQGVLRKPFEYRSLNWF